MSTHKFDFARWAAVAAASLAFGAFEFVVFPLLHPDCMRVAGLDASAPSAACGDYGAGLWALWLLFTAAAALAAFLFLKVGRSRIGHARAH